MAQAVHGEVLGMFAFVLSLIRSSSFGYCMTQATVLARPFGSDTVHRF